MKRTSLQTKNWGIALSAIFALLLFVPLASADEISEFEKLLQDAIKGNREAASSPVKTPLKEPASVGVATTKPTAKPIPVPEKETGKPKIASSKEVPVKETPKVASKPLPRQGTLKLKDDLKKPVEIISDGWSTVTPNDPNTVVHVRESEPELPFAAKLPVEVPNEKAEETTGEMTVEVTEEEPVAESTEVETAAEPAEESAEETAVEETAETPKEEPKEELEAEIIAEPAKVTAKDTGKDTTEVAESETVEPKKPKITPRTPPIRSELSAALDDLANDKTKEESQTEKNAEKNAEKSVEKSAEKNQGKAKENAGTKKDEVAEVKQAAPAAPNFDSDTDETVYKVIDANRCGDPNAKEKLRLMYDEIVNGLRTRNVTGRYDMWKNYAKSTLRGTSGINTGSELDGRCRLSWYQQLYAEPIQSVFAVEEFSRQLHDALSGTHRHIAEIMPEIRKRMDVPERNNPTIRFPECKTPFDAVAEIKRALIEAQMAHSRALSPLTQIEIDELKKNLVPTFAGPGCVNGHTIPARSVGRRHVDIMERMDKSAIYDGIEALLPLTNPSLLALLDKLPEDAFPTVMMNGTKVQHFSTSAGDIIIGGRENNVYDLDSPAMRDVICVIDLGGNDTYREGICNLDRPVLAIVDLHGNDVYTGSKPGIQGGSVLGISLLLDAEGDDTYSAVDIAQGSAIGGAGLLIDFAGNDTYKALRRVQGHALMGLGMLIDKKGTDKYHAALWAQGFGAPGGFGVLEDTEGNDHYYCGGLYLDSYPEHPGYDGWGQGVGAGIRQVANGGVGAILDGSGDDVYEVDYFGQGGGYWLGVGFARDFSGSDIRHGTTKTAYNGGPRQQQEWTRFANGFGCHYSLGYCFDDAGNDVYGGKIMGTGMAWDLSIGYLCDFNGSDKFTATGGMTQGVGAEGSIGILLSYGGDDEFMGRNQAYANGNITYHSPSNCGGNISFLVNYGGNDKYGCGAKNNTYVQRGAQSGFLIDRPTDKEAADDLVALQKMIEDRNKEIADYDAAVSLAKDEAMVKGRRYVPRTRRPLPISAEQQQRLGAVPSFDSPAAKTSAKESNVN
jgi:hypothetical protein